MLKKPQILISLLALGFSSGCLLTTGALAQEKKNNDPVTITLYHPALADRETIQQTISCGNFLWIAEWETERKRSKIDGKFGFYVTGTISLRNIMTKEEISVSQAQELIFDQYSRVANMSATCQPANEYTPYEISTFFISGKGFELKTLRSRVSATDGLAYSIKVNGERVYQSE